MESIELRERLNIYFKNLKHYVLGTILFFIFLVAYSYLAEITHETNSYLGLPELALNFFKVILILVPLYLIGKIHIQIGKSLFRNNRKEFLLTLPILTVWTFTLAFKLYVNEAIFSEFGGYGRGISKGYKVLNYFLFSLWTTIFWWEVYYRVITFFQRINLIRTK
ncbi:hypothetical protein [Rufibacter roseus]|uniref:Uncharacterized protein n=1 Tax=Rufibacter roseus TaxID=1567108 RepID=A0ABW2DM15_9BACT|nr:hypothetical protein [Rufibacter roseus]